MVSVSLLQWESYKSLNSIYESLNTGLNATLSCHSYYSNSKCNDIVYSNV